MSKDKKERIIFRVIALVISLASFILSVTMMNYAAMIAWVCVILFAAELLEKEVRQKESDMIYLL